MSWNIWRYKHCQNCLASWSLRTTQDSEKLGTEIQFCEEEDDINFVALPTQKVTNVTRNVRVLCRHFQVMENLLKPYFMCHVRAEQQWKGQTMPLSC